MAYPGPVAADPARADEGAADGRVTTLDVRRGPAASRPRRTLSAVATAAEEIRVGRRTVRVSSPDKPYFPERGLTKLDVVRYFLAVGDGILRALRDRPTMLERWPAACSRARRSPRARTTGVTRSTRNGCRPVRPTG
ncbi:hypothetical protein GCM10029963_16360 [Micromonospora andamanensis]